MALAEARATVLIENTGSRPELATEHGLAVWLEAGGAKVLFDTGASGLVCDNAEKLGVDLSEADAVVLSHGHYDHAGGLSFVAEKAPGTMIWAHPAAKVRMYGRKVFTSRRHEMVAPGLWTTGEVERVTDFEPGDPRLMPDDQAVFFKVDAGIVVVVGCAHAGVVNTLRQVQRLTGAGSIHAVLGGMHLLGASDERVRKTAEAFREMGVRRIGPCHCTGEQAMALFQREFPVEFFRPGTGAVVTFGEHGG